MRDRHTDKLAEIELNPERPPLDEADPGRFYAFKRGEEVSEDHEAVLDAPGAFGDNKRESCSDCAPPCHCLAPTG